MPRTVSDLLLASFFAFALFGNVTVDVWMGFDVDLLDSGFPPDSLAAQYHRLVWQSGRDYDPLFIDNSGYMPWALRSCISRSTRWPSARCWRARAWARRAR